MKMETVEVRHGHLCCGIGAGAKGMNRANPRVGNRKAKFRCLGGIDVDAAAIRDFERLTGVRGTVRDLFTRQQFIAFHGVEPPPGWREAGPDDIRVAFNNEHPHILFISSPCKGASGLLPEQRSKLPKYQALNELTLRCIWLMCEAYKDDPVELLVFENVPRLATRCRGLLDQINGLLRSYGYAVAETSHDCGEIGGLAQSRKRFLLVARHIEKVPPFLYEPEKKRLRPVGDVLGRMPLPGDPRGGPMHRIPSLQWKTWVRLAFVEAGSDWRSLNKLRIENGHLADYLIVPEDEQAWHPNVLGVTPWDRPANTVTSESRPTTGRFAVADPRTFSSREGSGPLGVHDWTDPCGTVTGNSRPGAGAFSVADVRFDPRQYDCGQYGVGKWDEASGTIINVKSPGQGTFAVQDPRLDGVRHSNVYRIVSWDQIAKTVTGGHGATGGGVADPRGPQDRRVFNKYAITDWNGSTGTVIGGDDHGAYGVADPRPDWKRHSNNLAVMEWEKPAKTVIAGGKGVQGGWMSVADPRAVNRTKGDSYLTAGQYGVVPWDQPSGAVSAAGGYDNGRWSVADPRHTDGEGAPVTTEGVKWGEYHQPSLPGQNEKTIAIIRALDGTWHRPFTTLELAGLQSLIEPEEYLELDGLSDSAWRERIGNAVPPAAAEAIGNVMGTTLLLAWSGETFVLGTTPIWVRNIAVALSVSQSDSPGA